jgi:hypothetical protein
LYVTVSLAVAASAPDSVAESVTAVPGATVIVAPVMLPPDSEVASVVGAGVTVAVSDPHGLVDAALLVSPE